MNIKLNKNQKYIFDAIYIHLPFCHKICPFCNFNVFKFNPNRLTKYLNDIQEEIKIWKQTYDIDFNQCQSIYFGGGTPSIYQADQLRLIIELIDAPESAIKSIELNPEDCTENYLQNLIDLKFNRLSIGIQSFLDKSLKILNRVHTAKDNIKALEAIKKTGYKNVNLDLIYGFPGNSIEDLTKDLNKFINWQPQHISAYNLTIEPKTPLYKNKYWINWQKNNEKLIWEEWHKINKILPKAGYLGYELSNFAKKGYYSQQNLIYWNQQPFLGIGVGSFYRYNEYRVSNIKNLAKYNQEIKDKRLPILEVERLNESQLIDEYFLMNLRCSKGLEIKKLEKLFPNIKWEEYFDNISNNKKIKKLVVYDRGEKRIYLTLDGLFLADQITTEFSILLNNYVNDQQKL